MEEIWKALLVEFFGTFILVFVGAGAVALTAAQGGSLLGSAFAFGLALLVIVYVFATWSGAHVNPAVSLGYAVSGRMSWLNMIGYWIAQFLGGILAAALIVFFFGSSSGVGASVGSLTSTAPWKALLFEALLTFFLVFAALQVTNNPALALVSGLVIGMILTADMLVGFPLTGASMNPARSLGPALFSNNIGSYWIYFFGPLLGAIVAALLFRLMNASWKNPNACVIKKESVCFESAVPMNSQTQNTYLTNVPLDQYTAAYPAMVPAQAAGYQVSNPQMVNFGQ